MAPIATTQHLPNIVEYVDQQIKHLEWEQSQKAAHIITGSRNFISVWQFLDDPNSYDQLPIAERASEAIKASAAKVHLIENIAFTALVDGTILIHELENQENGRKFLRLRTHVDNLHPNSRCTDMMFCPQTNRVITCGADGCITSLDVEQMVKTKNSYQLSDSPLKCMDKITPNEVVCGTLNGCLKHFDLRSEQCVGTFANKSLSTLTCIQRNPNVNHLATGGNDQGSVIRYDLRNQASAMAQLSAHNAGVTAIRYRPRDPNILYSSSCDGDLFRWDMNNSLSGTQLPKKVESVGCTKEPLSVLSFDINHMGDLIYTTDHGALFYRKLSEIAS